MFVELALGGVLSYCITDVWCLFEMHCAANNTFLIRTFASIYLQCTCFSTFIKNMKNMHGT